MDDAYTCSDAIMAEAQRTVFGISFGTYSATIAACKVRSFALICACAYTAILHPALGWQD